MPVSGNIHLLFSVCPLKLLSPLEVFAAENLICSLFVRGPFALEILTTEILGCPVFDNEIFIYSENLECSVSLSGNFHLLSKKLGCPVSVSQRKLLPTPKL